MTFQTFFLLGIVVVSGSSSEHFDNVALSKTCNMSSDLRFQGAEHPPGFAVNGDTRGVYIGTRNCIHTAFDDTTPWWEVYLGRPYSVHRISVWARTGELGRMRGCIITVDRQECYRFNKAPDTRDTNLTCTSGVLIGSVVRVSKNTTGLSGDGKTINICEVQVFSCSDGYWGSGCDKRCGNCSNSEVCDKVTGYCSSCPPGLQPPRCDTECEDGMYGHNCTQPCGEGCTDSSCDKVSGQCTCRPGWLPPFCENVCPLGMYGLNCMQNCSVHCNDTCDKTSGSCTCNSGYSPPLCLMAELASDLMEEEVTPQQWIVVGAVIGSVAVLVMVITVIVVILRRSRSQAEPHKKTDGWSQEHVPSQTTEHATHYQNLPDTARGATSDSAKVGSNPSIQLQSVYEAVGGEPNDDYENRQQGMPSAVEIPAVPFPATAGEVNAGAEGSGDEPPFVSSAPSVDQPYEILDSQRETTYDRPQMYQNTLEHHVYNDLKT